MGGRHLQKKLLSAGTGSVNGWTEASPTGGSITTGASQSLHRSWTTAVTQIALGKLLTMQHGAHMSTTMLLATSIRQCVTRRGMSFTVADLSRSPNVENQT